MVVLRQADGKNEYAGILEKMKVLLPSSSQQTSHLEPPGPGVAVRLVVSEKVLYKRCSWPLAGSVYLFSRMKAILLGQTQEKLHD